MLVLENSKTIVGNILFDIPKATHQSALRIMMKTSPAKFIKENPSLTGVLLIKAWMKGALFVSSGDSGELGKEKAFYMMRLKQYASQEPLDGCLMLEVVFTYAWLKGHSKKLRAKYEYVHKNTKPDNDNKIKVFQDCLEKSGLVINDSRFCKTVLEKRYGDHPGIKFRISECNAFGRERKIVSDDVPFD